VLPAGTGQETSIVVFAEGETALRAEDVADQVLSGDELAELGDDDDAAKDLADATDFFLAENMMQNIGRFLRDGPRTAREDAGPHRSGRRRRRDGRTNENTVQMRAGNVGRSTPASVPDMSAEEIADNIDVIVRRLHADLERAR